VWNRKINRGKVSDLTLPLEEVAEGYRAMDERRALERSNPVSVSCGVTLGRDPCFVGKFCQDLLEREG
jgi:hypothetical protein